MRSYFSNPEIKLGSVILISITAFFMCLAFITLNLYYNNLKDDYIRNMGALAVRVIDADPALQSDIAPIFGREASSEEAARGEALLGQYGLTKNLENGMFPYMGKTVLVNNFSIAAIFLFMTSVLFILNYFQYSFFYKRIRKLTKGAQKVIEGEYDLSISENSEGDFSKLAVSFNSMREIIRNNINELKREKVFLVDLLSDISHQIKTPLSTLIVYNDIMLNKELSPEQRNTFLLNNQAQLDRMSWLIQSLLKIAKLDAKAIKFEKISQSLNRTVQESIYALEEKAVDGNIKITLEENDEVVFEHDRQWLEESFINIIKNGIEHTPSGGEIRIRLMENPIYRRVTIEDNGEGIREEDLPNIFKRFYKAKSSRKTDSVGIGLALARSIIESHNGIIEVQSSPGKGTLFSISFLKY